jgi:Domain of unknown function (DUF4340)
MKLHTLVLTIALLAILSALVYFAQRPRKPADLDPRTGQAVLDVKILEKTARIRLSDQGKTVLLAKQPDGRWGVSSYYELPAEVAKLGHFLDDLSSAKIQRLVTRTPERLARLEFKDASIAFLDTADKAIWMLTLGKDAEGGGRFVRFDDEQKGYLANLSTYLDSDAKNWADSLLISVKPDELSGIEIGFAGGESVVATRAKKEAPWTAEKAPASQRIKGDRITSVLTSFASLRFQDTSDLTDANAEAARKNSRTVRFTTFDHKTITVQLGRKPEEKKPEAGSQKPEAGGQLAAPKPAGEGGKPGAASQDSNPNPEPKLSTVASAKAETLNPEPAAAPAAPPPAKPEEPKVETIPAGPVYAFITDSDAAASVNGLMKKRAYQVLDWSFTSLPQKPDELFEPIPPPPVAEKKAEAKPAEPTPEIKPADPKETAIPPSTPPKP